MGKRESIRTITKNKKAYHDYEILETIEAGIVLKGTEVKSIREGRINLKDSYVKMIKGEPFLIECHISPYPHGGRFNHEPTRERKLLLKKREIKRLIGKIKEKGITLIPLKVYFKNSLVKVLLGLCKGKKSYDKKAALKEKAIKREIERALKKQNF